MESTLISGYEISGIILTGEHLGRAEELLGEEPLILEFLVRTDGIIDSISLIFSLDSSGLRLLLGGMFKMDTNARAAAENLKNDGWKDAFMANSTGSVYYSIIGTTTSLDDANALQKAFRSKHPDYPFIGLPGAPVLLHF